MAEETFGRGLTDLQVETILMAKEDHEALLRAIESPPKPNSALNRLMRLVPILGTKEIGGLKWPKEGPRGA